MSTCFGPVPLAGREWAMIGAPVWTLAIAAARWTFSTFSVMPGSSAAHLMNAALISVPWIPSSMSATNSSAICSGVRFSKKGGRWS